jgi:ribosomal protein L29
MIADNQIATNAGWNDEMLAAELAALKDEAFDLRDNKASQPSPDLQASSRRLRRANPSSSGV